MAEQNELFSILDTTDSTNNYAAAQAHAGLAKNGQTWFAKEQTAGKGQRGKTWISAAGQNLLMSILIAPGKAFKESPFLLSMLIAHICRQFLSELAESAFKIKWPNDLYWRDRKTGGILIENIYKGKEWDRAIIGIGININQLEFGENAGNAVSLKQVTGKKSDPVELARKLSALITEKIHSFRIEDSATLIAAYNQSLYKAGETVKLKKDNAVFATKIIRVNPYGQLITGDVMERSFEVGEVAWLPDASAMDAGPDLP